MWIFHWFVGLPFGRPRWEATQTFNLDCIVKTLPLPKEKAYSLILIAVTDYTANGLTGNHPSKLGPTNWTVQIYPVYSGKGNGQRNQMRQLWLISLIEALAQMGSLPIVTVRSRTDGHRIESSLMVKFWYGLWLRKVPHFTRWWNILSYLKIRVENQVG